MYKYLEFFARFYDTIYDSIRADVDSQYFINKIKSCKGKILEVGVGTGRFFIDALSQGADIYGIDISPSMIKVLKNKLEKTDYYRIKTADIVSYKDEQQYDLIVAPFRVFSHLLTTEAQLKALNNINSLLSPKARFIFDLFVPNLELLKNGLHNFMDFNKEYAPGENLKRIVNMNADLVNQISNVEFKLTWTEKNKEYTETWNIKLRYFFRYELEYLIDKSDLKLVNIYGDYYENSLNSDSKDFVIYCTKGD